MTTSFLNKMFDALAIRDLNAYVSNWVDLSQASAYVFEINNTLNQAGNYTWYVSTDGGTSWHAMGTAQALAASSGADVITFAGGKTPLPASMVRITYIATIAPTAGALTINAHLRTA